MNDILLLQGSKTPYLTLNTFMEWTASLVIAEGHFNLAPGFVWICTG